jgi:hypothetical protein
VGQDAVHHAGVDAEGTRELRVGDGRGLRHSALLLGVARMWRGCGAGCARWSRGGRHGRAPAPCPARHGDDDDDDDDDDDESTTRGSPSPPEALDTSDTTGLLW